MQTRFAVVDGQRREAEPGLTANCPVCGQAMIAKCGEHRVWHWAHRGRRNCDPWWETETEWHRSWKDRFPKDCQEYVHWAEDGEKHVADVKTQGGVVLEFQHSFLRREERQSREAFYPNMVWVVNGLRRLRDRSQFYRALEEGRCERLKPPTFSVIDSFNECALLRDWRTSEVPVFFDFGALSDSSDPRHLRFDAPVLWLLYPGSSDGRAFVSPVIKSKIVDAWLEGQALNFGRAPVAESRANQTPPVVRVPQIRLSRRPMTFRQYLARKGAARRRFRL